MATPKQSAANRRNAQKSSGPRATAGKAISRSKISPPNTTNTPQAPRNFA
jgi:hypothetical protein